LAELNKQARVSIIKSESDGAMMEKQINSMILLIQYMKKAYQKIFFDLTTKKDKEKNNTAYNIILNYHQGYICT